MRLLNSRTLKLEEFLDSRAIPEYAIISHKWGTAPGSELSYEDAAGGLLSSRHFGESKGFDKVYKGAEMARKDGHKYFWIDTCMYSDMSPFHNTRVTILGCIQQSSSAELSEGINSMFM
jgi:hypothetical protein